MTSFRAEDAGLLDLLLYLIQYPNPCVHIHIDCQALITRSDDLLKSPVRSRHFKWPHIDLLWQITLLRRQLPRIRLHHVKAHTADDDPYKALPLPVEANKWCDQAANEARNLALPVFKKSQAVGAYLQHADNIIHAKELQTIRNAVTRKSYHTYLSQKYQWSPAEVQGLDWETIKRSIQSVNGSARWYLVKTLHGWLPTPEHTAKYTATRAKCPFCQQPSTQVHHLQCTHMQDCWTTLNPNSIAPKATQLQREYLDTALSKLRHARDTTQSSHDCQALLLRGWWTTAFTNILSLIHI